MLPGNDEYLPAPLLAMKRTSFMDEINIDIDEEFRPKKCML